MLNEISADFPFKSNFIDVLGSKLHYVDEGKGDPIVFLHGIPTSTYLWRNIIPSLSENARCIGLDLIGLGKSDKPDIDYTISDHIEYFQAFCDALNLDNITLVMHGWGSVIGFDVAMRQPDKFKALAFLESHIMLPSERDMISLPIQEITMLLSSPDGGHDVIMNSNYYVNKVMPLGVLRPLSDKEMQAYQAPFQSPGSSRPIWQYLQELPLGDDETEATQIIARYSKELQISQLPKLMMYGIPGFLTTIEMVQWARDHLPHLTQIDIGDALHYPQESNPDAISNALKEWYGQLQKQAVA